MRQESRERFLRHRLQRIPLVSDPGMHHGTCVTHLPWCMSGSLIRGGGENGPGFPGACATSNFACLVRGPCNLTSISFQKPWRFCTWNHSALCLWPSWPITHNMTWIFHTFLMLIQRPVLPWMLKKEIGCKFQFLIYEFKAYFTSHYLAMWSVAQLWAWVSPSWLIVRVVHVVTHSALPMTWPHQMGWEDASTDVTATVYVTML